jgi:hypothetical protein
LNGRENVVAKNGPFSLVFSQIVALMLPHRSVFAGLLLVAIVFPPWLKYSGLSHRKRRAHALFIEEARSRGDNRWTEEDQAAGGIVLLTRVLITRSMTT